MSQTTANNPAVDTKPTDGNEIHLRASGMNSQTTRTPKDYLPGLLQNWQSDIVSGLIIFLIALPLCLGISIASGVPPMAGIIAAVVGGIVVSQINGSYVTINGPAAGLIVVILGSVDRLGGGDVGYHATLAAVVVSGILLFLSGIFKAGALGDFFPSTVVHGMLASIGIIIMSKQLPFVLGVKPPAKEPLELIAKIPEMFANANPEIAIIGIMSLLILVMHASISNKALKRIPAPIVVVLIAIFLGGYFDLSHAHRDMIAGHAVELTPKFLVTLPSNLKDAIQFPDFSHALSYAFMLSVVSITLVQGIETLLSCAAVDKLDPYRRHANLSRDVGAVGLGSAISAAIGGLPMIAEIVRSTANVANGAKTRWSNFFHGCFMLAAILFCASYINQIPLAALAALLVFTGFRLASPKVFKEAYQIGAEQLFIFVTTIIATLMTDLLIGVAVGIATKFALHTMRGVPVRSLFKSHVNVKDLGDNKLLVEVEDSAIFSNFISLKRQLEKLGAGKNMTVDLSRCKLVDHTVMERLHEWAEDYAHKAGQTCTIIGLDSHKAASSHPFSARRAV